MIRHWPVVIVGGGPAASATAIQLGRAGIASLIVEKGDDTGEKIGETLPPDARPLLAELGIADRVTEDDHLPCYGNRSVWGHKEPVERSFITSPYGAGWHLDRRAFERLLIETARDAGAERVTETVVASWDRTGDGWSLGLSSGEVMTAGIVVDATGRAAWFARRQGARRRRDDPLVAVVAFLATDGPPDPETYTFIEAVEAGWWYSATLPLGRLATAYITDPALLDRSMLGEAGWLQLVARAPHTAKRVGRLGYALTAAPVAAEASGSLLSPLVGARWAAVGDAAAAFDPLSSYGIVGALAGGLRLGGAVAESRGGDGAGLGRYAADVADGFAAYEDMRRGYYAAENRWPQAPFWARRHREAHASEARATSGRRWPEPGTP